MEIWSGGDRSRKRFSLLPFVNKRYRILHESFSTLSFQRILLPNLTREGRLMAFVKVSLPGRRKPTSVNARMLGPTCLVTDRLRSPWGSSPL